MAIKVKGYHHAGVVVKDLDRAERFYGVLMGLTKLPRPEFSIKGAWYEMASGAQLHLMVSDESVEGSTRHVALEVDDFEEAQRVFKENEIQVQSGPGKRADGSDAMSILDTEGNLVEITAHG
jgi:catechol 2,3-dioxygenase-like lactoylglutathione lyase family enzyme